MAAAAVGPDLHVLIKTNVDVLYDAIRVSADGTWKGFNDMSGAVRIPSSVMFPSIAAAGVNGDLQILVMGNNGKLYHALRSSSSGSWNGLNDVQCCAMVPGGMVWIAAAAP